MSNKKLECTLQRVTQFIINTQHPHLHHEIKLHQDEIDVILKSDYPFSTIFDGADNFRMYAQGDVLFMIYTFNIPE